jgi:hypothetical protein
LAKLKELEKLLEIVSTLLTSIRNAKISETDKEYFLSLVAYQYLSKIKPAFTAKLQEYKSIPEHLNLKTNPEQSESVFTNRISSLILSIDSKIG